jgi:S-DNA-T family DNA segregation ATPase FtsK/SpoIIIE
MAPADASPLAGPTWEGPRYVVLFDDYDLVTGPTGGPLQPLLDVLAVGGDVGLHVVLARRVGGSARGAYEAVFSRLRELGSPGMLLSGDPGEGPLLGGTKAAPQPAGRGLFVSRGERPVLVQTAFSPPTPVPGSAVSSSWTSGES